MKSRSKVPPLLTFAARDGREFFKSRVGPPRAHELVATCDRLFEVLGGRGKTIKVRPL